MKPDLILLISGAAILAFCIAFSAFLHLFFPQLAVHRRVNLALCGLSLTASALCILANVLSSQSH